MDDQQDQNNQQPELQAVPTPSELETKLAECEQKRDEYLAGWQRAKADFMNYKKEEMRRLEELAKYATEEFIKELIVIINNFSLAIAAMEKAGTAEKGVYLVRSQIEDILKRRGVERLSVSSGDAFDPSVMESVAEVESPGAPGTVADEIEPGYRLHEKVIRPIRVRLVKEQS